jgi:hypothetical protein
MLQRRCGAPRPVIIDAVIVAVIRNRGAGGGQKPKARQIQPTMSPPISPDFGTR